MISLIKSTFYKEEETKAKLCDFIKNAKKLSMGEKCKEFEKEFSKYQGRKYSVLYNSGSSANLALIQALLNMKKLHKGDKVGFSAITWATNVTPLIQLGLEPIPIDVSLEHLNVSSDNLLKVLERTEIKTLFLTNLLGFCGDVDKIKNICDERGIILLEDNCESLGSRLGGVRLGNFGLASTFSFFVGHHMSTIEGGMVCTDNENLYDILMMTRAHGWSRDLENHKKQKLKEDNKISNFYDQYTFYTLGQNLRPTEITGFLGLEQLKYIDEIINQRNENFKKFHSAVSNNIDFIPIKTGHIDFVSNFAYPLVFINNSIMEEYKAKFENKIEIRPIVGGAIVEQPFFIDYMNERGRFYDCPNASRVHSLGFYFPNNPELSNEEISEMTKLLTRGHISLNSITSDKKITLSDINNQKSVVNSSLGSSQSPSLWKPEPSQKVKKAFITGVTGQDGSYLAEFLLSKGYEVHGLVRRASSFNRGRLKDIYHSLTRRHKSFFLHYGDMTDSSSLKRIISMVKPDEIYNLAAQSHVQISFETPEYTADADALGVLKLLEIVRSLELKETKVYQASTSELFGLVQESPQKETTPFYPRSPYGIAKLYAYWIVKNYREAYNMFACNGILFNHESPRRGENFVTKKITQGVAAIKIGKDEKIYLGNLGARRDWGYAPDYVESMWLMLQQDKPDDYVIATGETHSVREFVESAFEYVGIKIRWGGEGINEKGIDINTGRVLVEIDPLYFRPTEVEKLVGDYSKAKRVLGWEPKIKFKELVKLMVDADLRETAR